MEGRQQHYRYWHCAQQAARDHSWSSSTQGRLCPVQRKRSARHLTLTQREEISRGLAAGKSLRSIAADLQVAASTVSREIARNDGAAAYRALKAESRAERNGRRPKACKLALNDSLRLVVEAKLQEDWSPQQISGWLRKNHHGDLHMQLSHEAIYRTLFIQARGLLKRELLSHLRSRRMMRRSKDFTTKGIPRGQITDAVSIQRPWSNASPASCCWFKWRAKIQPALLTDSPGRYSNCPMRCVNP